MLKPSTFQVPLNNISPPKPVTSPPKHVPGQPIYEPQVRNPPPLRSPPPHKGSQSGVWCVAKPTVPDSIIQAAMDYACGSGADCKSIQPNEACFQPNTLIAHASYAFNSNWQNRKGSGGTCDFGGTAMLVTVDPSFDKVPIQLQLVIEDRKNNLKRPMSTAFYFRGIRTCTFARCDSI